MSDNGTSPEQRVAIVTGAGSGIGRSVATALAREGFRVVAVGRTESTLKQTCADDEAIRPLVVDLTDDDAPARIVTNTLEQFSRIDVLVNNAGTAEPSGLGDITAESFDRQVAVNLKAPLLLTKAAIGPLSSTKGIVLNLSSAGSLGRRGWPQFSVYGSTKVGIDFLTRTWAIELAPLGIRVLSIAPGVVDRGPGGPMGDDTDGYNRFLDSIAEMTPLRRIGTTSEIGWWVAQLVKPEAAFATGTILVIDGGLSVT